MNKNTDIDFKPLYLLLWKRITLLAEDIKSALENGDIAARDRMMLRAYAELTRAQIDAEELYLSQGE